MVLFGYMEKMDELEKKEERLTTRLPSSLLERAREKAGKIPLSRIVRRLLEMWLSGETEIKRGW